MSGNSIDMHGFNPLANSYIQIPGATTNSTADVGSLFLNDMASLTNSFATMFLDNAIQSSMQKQAAKETTTQVNAMMSQVKNDCQAKIESLKKEITLKEKSAEIKGNISTLESNNKTIQADIDKAKENLKEKYTNYEAEKSRLESKKADIQKAKPFAQAYDNATKALTDYQNKSTEVDLSGLNVTASPAVISHNNPTMPTFTGTATGDDSGKINERAVKTATLRAQAVIDGIKAENTRLEQAKSQAEQELKTMLPENATIVGNAVQTVETLEQGVNGEINDLNTRNKDLIDSSDYKSISDNEGKIKLNTTIIDEIKEINGEIEELKKELKTAEAEMKSIESVMDTKEIEAAKTDLDNANTAKSKAKDRKKSEYWSSGNWFGSRIWNSMFPKGGQKDAISNYRNEKQNQKNAAAAYEQANADETAQRMAWLKAHGYVK